MEKKINFQRKIKVRYQKIYMQTYLTNLTILDLLYVLSDSFLTDLHSLIYIYYHGDQDLKLANQFQRISCYYIQRLER